MERSKGIQPCTWIPQNLVNHSFKVIVDDYSLPVSSVFIQVSSYVERARLFCFANVNFGCSCFLFRSILQEAVLANQHFFQQYQFSDIIQQKKQIVEISRRKVIEEVKEEIQLENFHIVGMNNEIILLLMIVFGIGCIKSKFKFYN